MIDLSHGQARLLIGDVFRRMADLPDGSIDLIVSSPPFLALRSYLPADHPDKAKEIGSEATPAEFLDTLLRLTAEWRRLLAPHGSIAIELGDTYAGSTSAGDTRADETGRVVISDTENHQSRRIIRSPVGVPTAGPGWPLDKSLTGIPDLYAIALQYGINPLTGAESPAGRWRVRNKIPWCRPNPPVGALGDKCRPATSYITVATITRNRWWDMEDCRTPHQDPNKNHTSATEVPIPNNTSRYRIGHLESNPAGAPLLDYWVIPTQPYKGAHYATFPSELPARLIKLMCPRDVCTTCGEPRRRIVGEAEYTALRQAFTDDTMPGKGFRDADDVRGMSGTKAPAARHAPTLGWSDCGHNTWRPGVVLDPFAGSGTTLAAATGLGRAAIGIDLDARNADLARQRVGMFVEIEGDDELRMGGRPRPPNSNWHTLKPIPGHTVGKRGDAA